MASSPLPPRRAYPSDLSDAQWSLIDPLVTFRSQRGAGSKGGRPPTYEPRDVVDAILYVARTGCSWRQLPHDLPPCSGVFRHFRRWSGEGTLDEVGQVLHTSIRIREGRDPAASAGAVDSQSVQGAATVGAETRGYDAGKKVNGRKRHLVVDTMGLLIVVMVTAASVQDRDSGIVLERAKKAMPSLALALVWADGGYSRRIREHAEHVVDLALVVVSKLPGQKGFAPLPRRWVVERTHAWMTGHRRMARDDERLPAHAEAMIKWAMVGLMARRLAPAGRRPWT